MYARVVTFSGAAQREEEIRVIRETVLPMLREHDGYAGYIALFDEENQRARAIILWDGKDAAVAAEKTFAQRRPQMASEAGLTVESVELYEALAVETEGVGV